MNRTLSIWSLFAATLFACGGSTPKPEPLPTPTPPGDIAGGVASKAPGNPDVAPLPLYGQIKKGVLPNGLTYYILKHGKPEHRARLWLAVNAGGMLEDDDQHGLAHFDEHM
ncbi:MAG: insulinase family protein, partial [Kofleriaceae bacterium]